VDVVAATGTSSGSDGAIAVILGVAVLLVFAAVVVRAFAQRWSSTRQANQALHDVAANALAGAPTQGGSEEAFEQRATESELSRLSLDTIAPFARTLERSRRLWVAEQRVLAGLRVLPEDAWIVEPYVLEDSRRIPFVVVGPTGIFVLCATDGPWTIRDLQTLTALADRLQRHLPGWEGEIQVVMCLAFETTEIRSWVGGDPEARYRGWIVGIDDLAQWLVAFDSGHSEGLHPSDIRLLDQKALPRWDRNATARLPKTPNYG
jgi:hypothetical protein